MLAKVTKLLKLLFNKAVDFCCMKNSINPSSTQGTPTKDCPICIHSHQTTNFQVLLTFLYFIIQQRSTACFEL